MGLTLYMKKDLFVTDFWDFEFPYHDQFKKQILDYLTKGKAQKHINDFSASLDDLNTPSLSSYGGDELYFEEEKGLQSFFKTQVKKFLKKIELEHDWHQGEWTNIDPWLNVNQKGNFNPPHTHPANDYSGCYYVSCPENSGHIHFLDPRPQHRFSSPNPKKDKKEDNWYSSDNKYDTSVFTYKVKESRIVFFPSWLMHYVDPNRNECLRISIPFNARYTQYE